MDSKEVLSQLLKGQIDRLRELIEAVNEEAEEQGADKQTSAILEVLEMRTAERLYCVRLGMIAQIDPIKHPSRAVLYDLAIHCWEAARVLSNASNPDVCDLELLEALRKNANTVEGSIGPGGFTPLMPDPKI